MIQTVERSQSYGLRNRVQAGVSVGRKNFTVISTIGAGSFGKVYLAEKCSQKFAIKVLSKSSMKEKKQIKRINVELRILQLLSSHKNETSYFPKLHAALQTSTHIFFVQDFIPCGEMYYHLGIHEKFTPVETQFFIAQCLDAIAHLHSVGIIFRDMKPENLMLDDSANIKLVDFGLSKLADGHSKVSGHSGCRSFVGTTEYLSPEMILRKGHGFAVDFWGCGTVLFEMLTGLPPWYDPKRKNIADKILHAELPPLPSYLNVAPTELIPLLDLYTRLLAKDPKQRIGSNGFSEIEQHPYFATQNGLKALSQQHSPYKRKLDHIPLSRNGLFFDDEFTCLPKTLSEQEASPHESATFGFDGFDPVENVF